MTIFFGISYSGVVTVIPDLGSFEGIRYVLQNTIFRSIYSYSKGGSGWYDSWSEFDTRTMTSPFLWSEYVLQNTIFRSILHYPHFSFSLSRVHQNKEVFNKFAFFLPHLFSLYILKIPKEFCCVQEPI